jgi:tripartite-type tricarboxylate transporter receptor subunit TctC
MRLIVRAIVLSILAVAAADLAVAQKWPDRTIRFVLSQAAGNATDIIARVVADQLTNRLGQPVVVENRPGGGNVIGTQVAARSAPDGYTFFLATAAALVTDPYTFKSLPYDPMKDFVPVARVAEVPFVILAHPGLPAKDFKALVALAKKEPGKLTIATDGQRRFSGMIVSWINKLAGIDILQVPYTAQRTGVADAVAGQVNLVIVAAPVAQSLIASKKLHPIAVTSTQRLKDYPTVPAIAETYPGFDFTGWQLLAAPTGTPADVLARMNKEVDASLRDPAVLAKVRKMGFDIPGAGTLKQAQDYVNQQHALWGKVVREIGVKPE